MNTQPRSIWRLKAWFIFVTIILLASQPLFPVLARPSTSAVRSAPNAPVTRIVTNTADSGAGTLRQAIADALPGDTIEFNLTFPAVIALTSGQLSITKPLTINGPGATNITVRGNNARRVFYITSTVTISGVTIANGNASYDYFGGGIYNDHGMLTLNNSTIMSNTAGYGGGISNSYGTLTVTNSTFSGNGNDVGGGFENFHGIATVTNSTFSGNIGTNGGGINNNNSSSILNIGNSTFISNSADIGGGIINWATLTVANSTFSGNQADTGGGIDNEAYGGGGILHITNSTFSGNLSGGLYNDRGILHMTNSTFSGNGPGSLYNYLGALTLTNTLVANTTTGSNCYGAIGGSNNLANDASCGATFTNSPSIRLGTLDNYGGSTSTFPLLPGSSAFETGNDAACPSTDQRGVARPQGLHCDIGAYEAAATILTLNRTGTGSGTITSDPPGLAYPPGTVITLTATPLISSTFTGWSGDASGSASPVTVTMDVNKMVTATFMLQTFVITPTFGANGNLTPGMPQTVNYGSNITFTITPNIGFHIVDVAVDGVSRGPIGSYTFSNVTANHTITAAFAIKTFVITPTAGTNGSILPGTAQTVTYGDSIAFTIAANAGYHIKDVGVDGVSQGAIGSYTFSNVIANHTITAAFTNTYDLMVMTAGNGKGIVTPTVGTHLYLDGTVVTLETMPNTGSNFAGWSGDTDCTDGSVTMDANKSCTAAFTLNTYTLTVATAGNGEGVVTPTVGTHPYLYGDAVILEATANTSSTFMGWSGDADCVDGSLTMDTDKVCTATFTRKTFAIAPSAGTNGSILPGTVQTVTYGDSITFTIAANIGYHIADVGVDGVSQGALSSYTFNNVTANHIITATFTRDLANLTVNIVGNGMVAQAPLPPYFVGNVITLTATPATGWSFAGWSGDLSSSPNPETILLDGDKVVTATFSINTYTLTIATAGNGGGVVGPSIGTHPYNYGTSVTLTAIANTDSTFMGWSGNADCADGFVMMDDGKSCTATFTLNTFVITPTAGTNGSLTPGTPQTVNYGDSITFTIAANTGYHIMDVAVDGVSRGALSGYTFNSVTANHIITAAFAINTFVITPTAGIGGNLTPSTPQTVKYGESITFTIAADAGYHIADVGVDGISQGARAGYTFNNVTADHTITAAFALNTYTLTVAMAGNGSGVVTPTVGAHPYLYGDVVTLQAMANTGSTFMGWSGDADCTDASVAMDADKSCTASFTLNTFVITPTAGANGSLTPNTPQTVNYGDGITFTITPNTGYHIADVNVDGGSQGAVSTYTFNNVTADHTITATFALNPPIGLSASNDGPTPLGSVTTLTATLSSGLDVTYAWNFGDGNLGAGAVTTHPYAAPGTYTAIVTATNSSGSVVAQTTVYVTTNPIAHAGPDQSLHTGQPVTLDGSASHDPGNFLPLTYHWQQTVGPAVALSGVNNVTVTFTSPVVLQTLILTFELTITNSQNIASLPDEILITVEPYRCLLPLLLK